MKIYFNGNYCELEEAKVPISDRGYIFGDGIYETFLIKHGKFIDFTTHMKRFEKSLFVMGFKLQEFNEIEQISKKLLEINNRNDALVYIQVTRGSFATREHGTPQTETPTIAIIPFLEREYKKEWLENGISCTLTEDVRWKRRDIKSLNMLGNVMAKQKALETGFDDAILFEQRPELEGFIVTESTSANVMIINKNGALQTHPANRYVLNGITKNRLLTIANQLKIPTLEKEFTVEELMESESVLLTNSGFRIRFCTSVDGKKINNGNPCKVGRLLFDKMEKFVSGAL